MFDILKPVLVKGTRPSALPGTENLIQNFTLDVVNYLAWKHTDVTSVPSDHFLVTLLITLGQKVGYDPTYTLQDLYRRTEYQVSEICTQFGYTSATNMGRLHIGDSGNTTLYVLGESPLRASVSVKTHYKDIVPLRYLSHDSTNVTMGSEAEAEDLIGLGFDIIEIDLGLLLVQYTLWMRDELGQNKDVNRSLESFVSMFVLPCLKISQYPLAFMNRMTALADGLPTDDTFQRLSKAFPDRTKATQSVLGKLVEVLLKRDVTFDYLLESVPVPLWCSLGAAQAIPDLTPTRQVVWALVCARHNLLRFLFTLARVEPDRARRFPVDQIRRQLQRLENDDTLRVALKNKDARNVEAKFEQLLALVYR